MKAVLMSIQPKWCELISNGKKTIEVRKTRPKLETPFKCYIYCTKEKCKYDFITISGAFGLIRCPECAIYNRAKEYDCNGKVIGEFVCDRIDEFHEWELSPYKRFYEEEKTRLDLFLKESCLTYEEVCEYRKNLPSIKPLFCWHISDLKIYNKPKELSEFRSCTKCKHYKNKTNCFDCDGYEIKRPPQSWCYVEVE